MAPDRQKILVKGGQLKDDQDMSQLGLKANQSLMLLGTAGELPKAPVVKTQFIEDMTDQQLAEKSDIPNGLQNTGNTCYLNSTLQAIRTVPEIQTELAKFDSQAAKAAGGSNEDVNLTTSLRDLFKNMGSTTNSVYPHSLLSLFRVKYPQFAEREQSGMYKQQDAEEAFSQLFTVLSNTLKEEGSSNFIDKYFGIDLQTKLECVEPSAGTPIKEGSEKIRKLDCHISINTNFLLDGLSEGLVDTLTKHNDELGRDAEYKLTKQVTRLPKYLTVHFMRFFWRADTRKKSKILRKVTFPFVLDATDLCSPELKKKLIPARDKFRDIEKEKEELHRAAKRARLFESEGSTQQSSSQKPVSDEKEKEMKAAISSALDPELAADPSCNATGLYSLSAVITHKGATADAGHYQCFVKNDKVPDQWFKFNDDVVTIVDQDRIETLSGGGESDSALILLYKAVEL